MLLASIVRRAPRTCMNLFGKSSERTKDTKQKYNDYDI